MIRFQTLLILLLSFSLCAQQQKTSQLLQVFGVVKSSNGTPLSLATVRVKNASRATFTSKGGVFSIVARGGDTLVFTYVGHALKQEILPRDTEQPFYYMTPLLSKEVVELPDFVADNLPTKAQFERDFVNTSFDDDMAMTALKNLDPEVLQKLMATLPLDGGESSSMELSRQMNQYVYYKQQPSFQILNPFAWAQFLKKLKSGEIKF